MFEEFMYQQAVRQTKQDMLKVGSRLAEKGLLVGKGGNYSVRIGENQILLTASGFCKSEISEEQISLVDMEGNLLEGLKPPRHPDASGGLPLDAGDPRDCAQPSAHHDGLRHVQLHL